MAEPGVLSLHLVNSDPLAFADFAVLMAAPGGSEMSDYFIESRFMQELFTEGSIC